MQVTDYNRVIYKDKPEERNIEGYYMDGYLAENLSNVPKYIKSDWDCIGIISGHSKVRIGKSSMSAQVGYFIAWMLAGGEMSFERDNKNKIIQKILKKPTEKVKFNLKENYVFSAEELQRRSHELYNKYGKNQVIIYDEGRQGLESARTMESVNKGMADYMQECGYMNNTILIVIPNYFKLAEDYACSRSLFLIDVFAKGGWERGYFNFYNENRKEALYHFGKKLIGTAKRYSATSPNFWGRFSKFLPFDKNEYEKIKKEALEQKTKGSMGRNNLIQRDTLIWYMNKKLKIKDEEILEIFEDVLDMNLSSRTLRYAREKINNIINKKNGY